MVIRNMLEHVEIQDCIKAFILGQVSQQPMKGYRGRPPSPELKLKMLRTYTSNQEAGVVVCATCNGCGQDPDALYNECKECAGSGRAHPDYQVSDSGR